MGLHPVTGPEQCPGCGADASQASPHRHPAERLRPGPDPDVREHYDGILFWSCNQCGQSWHHWDLTSRLHQIAARHMTGDEHRA